MTASERQADISARHIPVLLDSALDLLGAALTTDSPVLVDGTLGLGGHSEAFLTAFPHLKVLGIDRDTSALELARKRLARFGPRFVGVHTTYDHVDEVASEYANGAVQAILLDIGVSSMQIDERERGFSYSQDAPLDMRMDNTQYLTAADVLNTYPVEELTRILKEYGEERFARRIAEKIVARRTSRPWETSADLVELVKSSIPAALWKGAGNPAKRTFQALRIEVNAELDVLRRTLPAAINSLAIGGRIGVMSYHSLEDRIVKQSFALGTSSRTPPGIPVELAGDEPYLAAITRGAAKASAGEIADNPRAASVRFRVAERTRSTPAQMPQGATR
ncbi:16S rRNA (cytosine(1402)-N(4))-methyltransferase RsmH [Rarobacter faecitabidus]|uniref:16S rRNA (cytosine(1402)-N(4))-methyltransferase RsmH n=1 Tax=Rarobacter faecitabidus TaxID=13243 RepID=UPI001FE94229|nr:16S rRNA (cytosine(1402)-N(4))-methyltransferase RsmH [Rarobacter faecitabidus]